MEARSVRYCAEKGKKKLAGDSRGDVILILKIKEGCLEAE
jgi:hypothetical protein